MGSKNLMLLSACCALCAGYSQDTSEPALRRRARRTNSLIEAKWPGEGIDYVTQTLRKPIFDMNAMSNETVTLATDIIVDRPINILNVKPNFDLKVKVSVQRTSSLSALAENTALQFSNRWQLATAFQGKLSKLGIPRGIASPLNLIGFEVGGSLDSELLFARAQAYSQETIVTTSTASFDFAEVFTELAVKAVYTDNFIGSVALLPSRTTWDNLSDSEKRVYRSFFNDFGTHYARAAKFGGSYENRLVSKSCSLAVLESKGSDLSACSTNKITTIFSDLLGLDADILSSTECEGFTTGGSYFNEWNSTEITSSHRWQGGSAAISDSELTVDRARDWLNDVKSNPRSLVTQMGSISELLHQLLIAYSLTDEFCVACGELRAAGIQEDDLRTRVENMDAAFEEYLVDALKEKFERESRCEKTCGQCQLPPAQGCTCPELTSDCALANADMLSVNVNAIRASVRRPMTSQLKMYISGLGPDVDGGPYRGQKTVRVQVLESYQKRKDDSFYVEVVMQGLLRDFCVGSFTYRFDQVGDGREYVLNGPCRKASKGAVVKKPRIKVSGSAEELFPCDEKENFPEEPADTSESILLDTSAFVLALGVAAGWVVSTIF